LVLIKKESDGLKDPVTSEKYSKWRNPSLIIIPITLGFEVKTSHAIEPLKERELAMRKS